MNNQFVINCRPLALNAGPILEAIKVFASANLANANDIKLGDIKVCVSEAFTNTVEHAFKLPLKESDNVQISCTADNNGIHITVSDNGVGIADLEAMKRPFASTKANNSGSGMGFSIMDSFADTLDVMSTPGVGTIISMGFINQRKQ